MVIERWSVVRRSRGSWPYQLALGLDFFQQGGRPLLPVVITGGHAFSASLRY
jgi:hypothetical protein